MTRLRAGRLIVAAIAFAHTARGAEPVLKHLYPVAGQQGTTVSVTATGSLDPWPPQVWVDAPGIVIKPEPAKGKLTVEIAKDAAAGPHLVRFFNAEGASAPRFFIVSTEPELLEAEPNDEFKAPQKIEALPATISGRLDKAGDVDSFALTLQQGQTLTASVEAYVLGSTFDGMLRVVDGAGLQLAFNHDGRTLDPLLSWTAPRDGTFIVQLMGFAYPPGSSVSFTGGESDVYRLHLATEPTPRAPQPPDLPEAEPNDSVSQAQVIPIPAAVAGVIQKKGDEDRFSFPAVKGNAYELKLVTATGTHLAPWLKIESAEGKELARTEAGAVRDLRLVWKAPADGAFIAAVGDITHRAGADCAYRLSVAIAPPSITATAASHSIKMAAGKDAELKVAVKRENGFQPKLLLAVKDLPEGITAPEIDVPDKDGELTLKLTAAEGVQPLSQPLRVVVREKESGTEHAVRYLLTTPGEVGFNELVIEFTVTLWLTVTGKAERAP